MPISRSFKASINLILSQINGYRICSTKPRGRFLFEDLRRNLPADPIVFDIGANVGSWSREVLKELGPVGRLLCFEPMPELARKAEAEIADVAAAELHELAFSNCEGTSRLFIGSHDTTHSLIADHQGQASVTVSVETLDGFCDRHDITSIDLLKIDTEGNDLKVLEGAEQLLCSGCIRLLLVEVGMNPGGKFVPLESVRSHLHERGYRLFGLYDQQPEWSGQPGLLYANACFVHQPD